MKKWLSAILAMVFLFTASLAMAEDIPSLTVVMQGGCDVFSDPTAQSTPLGHVNAQQEMTYRGMWSDDERGMRWYLVDYNGALGWVPARYGELSGRKSDYLSYSPSRYIGPWQGGEGRPAAGEYYLYINDFVNGELFKLDFDIYRTWSFDSALAVIEGQDYATFATEDEQYSVIGRLDFMADRLALTILISDYPELPEDTYIVFERAAF